MERKWDSRRVRERMVEMERNESIKEDEGEKGWLVVKRYDIKEISRK